MSTAIVVSLLVVSIFVEVLILSLITFRRRIIGRSTAATEEPTVAARPTVLGRTIAFEDTSQATTSSPTYLEDHLCSIFYYLLSAVIFFMNCRALMCIMSNAFKSGSMKLHALTARIVVLIAAGTVLVL